VPGSLNRVDLIGHLGRDPEVRYTGRGVKVVYLSLATNAMRTNRAGERVEHTEWHRIVLFGTEADNAEKFLRKGEQVHIVGSLHTEKWVDNGGKQKYRTEIVLDSPQHTLTFLGRGKSDAGEESARQAAHG